MTARLLAVSTLLLAPLTAATAHAQAPGDQLDPAEAGAPATEGPIEMTPAAPPPPARVAPPIAPAPAPMCECGLVRVAREPLMANRWSVGLSGGGMGLKADGSTHTTSFGVGELAVRFRATPHLELEVTAGGGREQLDNGMEGDLEVAMFAGSLRYHINPYDQWNWFVMGGVGAAAVTFHDVSDQERKDATHPMGMLGVGVERRFNHFALQAELRAIGIADKKTDREMSAVALPGGGEPTTNAANMKQSGGELTIGGSWYF